MKRIIIREVIKGRTRRCGIKIINHQRLLTYLMLKWTVIIKTHTVLFKFRKSRLNVDDRKFIMISTLQKYTVIFYSNIEVKHFLFSLILIKKLHSV